LTRRNQKTELAVVADTDAAAPAHLEPNTQGWWQSVVRDWPLEEHHVRLLTLAGEAWDRAGQARAEIATAGITYTDRFGAPRLNPAVAVERDSRLAFARLIRELDLDALPEPSGMSLRGRRRR
jgi:phage terminase small subunit